MREVVTIQVGQCGNQLGVDFWEAVSAEHGIDTSGSVCDETLFDSGAHNVVFSELPNYHTGSGTHTLSHSQAHLPLPRRMIPRVVLVDTEPGTLESISAGRLGRLFSPDDYVYSQSGAGNNWAKGYYTLGGELIETIQDRVRKQAEDCDRLQAFQLLHSLGGGTGSGLGSLILTRLQEEYPDRLLCSHCVIPSPRVSDTVVEPYNTTLAMNVLVDGAHQCFTFDNEALYDIAQRVLGIGYSSSDITQVHRSSSHDGVLPTYKDLNALMASALSGLTCCVRFPGPLNCDLRKLAVNLVPFPRLHFYMLAQAPLTKHESERYRTLSTHDVVSQLFDAHNVMCGVDPRRGKYLTCGCLFRGDSTLSLLEIADELHQRTHKESAQFTEWIPNRLTVSLSVSPPWSLSHTQGSPLHTTYTQHTPYTPHSPPKILSHSLQENLTLSPNAHNAHNAHNTPHSQHHHTFSHSSHTHSQISTTLVANNTAIQELWQRVLTQFSTMLRRRAFVHWYTGEGMEESQLFESELNLQDLISEYQQYEAEEALPAVDEDDDVVEVPIVRERKRAWAET